ncbi:MAG: hypothetical protein KAJ14_10715 [Candidatus Omnitrophica bacterium]|nr:hypothetical protein [Spirochaetota bacterium]MCK5493570.1 hypothetical protein [Candidatus Omnitrophota bacterium]
MKLKTSTSFRALALNFLIQINIMNLKINAPTHTTILNWVHKVGYYQLMKPKEKADDWILIIDESIQIGQDKILMMFGIREKNIDFSRPLRFQDLVPVKELVNKSWSGNKIQEVLSDMKKKLGTIKYVVSDGGSNIKKALRLSNIPRIYDLTHKIACIIRKLYKKDEIYISLTKKITEIRLKYLQTEFAFLLPPIQRSKSKYLNINDISAWCLNTLCYYEINKDIAKEKCKKISWITEYRDFILELSELNELVCKIEKILKHNGFSNESWQKCNLLLQNIKGKAAKRFKEELNVYVDELKEKSANIDKLLITSDIIESSFGKYKNYVSQNPMACITNLILSIAAFTCSLEEEEIKCALEKTVINDVKEWTKENIGKTLFQKRREAYCFN